MQLEKVHNQIKGEKKMCVCVSAFVIKSSFLSFIKNSTMKCLSIKTNCGKERCTSLYVALTFPTSSPQTRENSHITFYNNK